MLFGLISGPAGHPGMAGSSDMYERALEKVGSAFRLAVLVQRRVRELIRGGNPLIPVSPEMDPIEIALREVLEDKVSLKDGGLEAEGQGGSRAGGKQKKAGRKT